MTFDITVLGANGGPLDGSTTCFMIKSSTLTYRDIIDKDVKEHIVCIDAGVGMGKLAELILDNETPLMQLKYYKESLTIEEAGTNLIKKNALKFSTNSRLAPIEIAHEIFKRMNTYLITHPHFDHIASLVINSPSFGHMSGKRVHALPTVLAHLQKHAFNDILWPDLASIEKGRFITLDPLQAYNRIERQKFQALNQQYNILSFQIIHGCERNDNVPYHSTAFLLQDIATETEILVFGDVEEDNDTMKGKNADVWSVASRSILQNKLKCLIIECSTVNQPRNIPLYGHLTPLALFRELLSLIESIHKIDPTIKDPLKGFNVLITHVKDCPTNKVDPKKLILGQLHELNEKYGLGVNFTILLAGQTYTV